MGLTTFETSNLNFSAGFPFGFSNGTGTPGIIDGSGIRIDNLNTSGVEDFGILRSSAGFNLHAGTVLFANGTDAGTSALRITSPFNPSFDALTIKLDTLLSGTGGTVTFTGLKTDGVTTVSHTVTLDNVRSLQTFRLPGTFDDLMQLDIEGPANFQFDDIDMRTSIIGTSGSDLIVGDIGAWEILGNGGNDVIHVPIDTWDSDDIVNGGAGNDDLVLRGDMILGEVGNISDIETLYLVAGNAVLIATVLGPFNLLETGENFDYGIVAVDAFLPAGQQRTISATTLRFNETLTFIADAETDGQYIVRSGAAADTIATGALNDQLFGGGGDDTLGGGGGTDILRGEAGNDFLDGGAGADDMAGSVGDDVYVIGTAFDTVTEVAAEGTDTISALLNYTLSVANIEILRAGGNAAINLTGDGLINTIIGNDAANILDGLSSSDTLEGRGGNDTLIGASGADILLGENGDDVLDGGSGDDSLDGGAGVNTATYVAAGGGAVLVDLAIAGPQDTLNGGFDSLANIQNLVGAANNDGLSGNGDANVLSGVAGNDVLDGRAGNDTLNGGDGVDVLEGGLGNDLLAGGAGSDTASFQTAVGFVVVNLGLAGAQNTRAGLDTLNSIERAIGSVFNDQLTGSAGVDRLEGYVGNDVLVGLGGNDTFFGGDGEDRMEGGAGDDILNGNIGRDTAVYSSALTGVSVNLALTTAQDTGGAGTDTLNSIERAIGSAHPDALFGNTSNNVLIGEGNDDILFGDGGSDVLFGGSGNDTLTGSAGQDSFMFDTALNALTNVDSITDFTVAYDKIRLDNLIFTAVGVDGPLSASAFRTGSAAADADDRIIYDSLTGDIFYDADGNGGGAQVRFAQVTSGLVLTFADFIVI